MAEEITGKRDSHKRVLLALLKAGGELNEPILSYRSSLTNSIVNIFWTNKGLNKAKMARVLKTLEAKSLIKAKIKKDEIRVNITEFGEIKANAYKIEQINIAQNDYWDKKWRLVMFDIPEAHKRQRDMFKIKLDQLGFYRLQNSVYAFPYECHNELEFIRSTYNIKQYVRLLIVEKLENEVTLRSHFNI